MQPFQTVLPAKPAQPPADAAAALTEALTRAEQAAQAKRLGEAIGICRDVMEASPEHAGAMALLGSILGHRGEVEEAISLLRRAVARNDKVAAWHNNLCSLYRMDCQLAEAEAAGRAALAISPGQPMLLLNLAKVFMDRGDTEQAISLFQDTLARDQQNAEAHLAIGQILLARGEMTPGWVEYEWRNRLEQARGMIPDMIRPEWNGMRLPNGTIMLIGDQGYGDTLQFARFIPKVAERCKEVVLACGAELEPLLSRLPGVSRSFTRWQDAPPHTVWCRLTSLGGMFDVQLDELPVVSSYVTPPPGAAEEWAAKLDARLPRRRLRVGLFWAGRPTHPNDRRRSLRLEHLASITDLPGIDFVSLQKVVPPADAQRLAAMPNIIDMSADLADFGVTAGIMANLDMLVSVDSAVIHLAGSMGVPVNVLMGTPSDWRWLQGRDDSPWYPGMRLFRQPVPGDWATPIARLREALRVAASASVAETV